MIRFTDNVLSDQSIKEREGYTLHRHFIQKGIVHIEQTVSPPLKSSLYVDDLYCISFNATSACKHLQKFISANSK